MKDELLPFKAHWLIVTFNKTHNVHINVTMKRVRVTIAVVQKQLLQILSVGLST